MIQSPQRLPTKLPLWPAATWLAGLILAFGAGAQQEDFLKPQDAFRYALADTGDAFEIDFVIEEGYYLYRSKLSFDSLTPGIELGNYELPEGLAHEDEYFGAQQVYRQRFFVSIPYSVRGGRPDKASLQLRLQGCADLGLCYTPQTWNADVRLIEKAAATSSAAPKPFGTFGGAAADFLPVDEVFIPAVSALDGNTIEVAIRVLPGYYLYRDKISASTASDKVQLGQLELPPGKKKFDEWFGEMEVYQQDVFAVLPLARATPEAMDLDLDVGYQGCADGGLCYPPISKTLRVSLPTATAVSTLQSPRPDTRGGAPVSEQARMAAIITNSPMATVIALFFGFGLLLAFTPCVLPMVPILSGIIAGEGDDVSPMRGFSLAFSYVMGMALIYTAAGVAAAAVGVQLQAIFNQPWILILFSALFVVLATSMFGAFDLQMPSAIQSRLASVSGRQKSGTFIGAFVMGALSSLIVTACVAPPLVATLTVIGQSGDMLRGGAALFALSLGMGAPLLVVGASAGKLLPHAGPWMVAVKNAFGFMMLGLAVWMLSRILPGSVTLVLWAILIFMGGVFLGGLTTLDSQATGVQKLGKGFGLLAVIYGAVLLLGSLAGGHSLLQPLQRLSVGAQSGPAEDRKLAFRRIKSVDDLDREVAAAAANGKSAMLDFYADWCVSCIEMEEYTFTDPDVQAALSNTVLLQADVTANDKTDQVLLQRFGVFGPPTIIFFGRDGIQRHGYEVVGYMKAENFAEHVRAAVAESKTVTAQR
ncbi:MAG: protein-disulfide reductase DsbD [Gammaproteobacteria bacterium]|nr:protein-disulfide reductase DsbD [Gammaproteobacteria bacterium]MDH4315250.1 protein-disulfide reductase DsbD [Gammaproteobacteria bacterium]MDH5215535.1 protein-disulfide reductase DsbD [Gammaproteobacteria bacterium]